MIQRHRWLLLLIALSALGALGLVRVGLSGDLAAAASANAALRLALAGGAAALYFAACFGFGALGRRAFLKDAEPGVAVTLALGLGLMLWLEHALGVFGLLSGPKGQFVGAGLLALGLIAAALTAFARRGWVSVAQAPHPARSPMILLAAPGIAVLLAAALSPPGWVWRSEVAGFDVLSYHAPLALEWARAAPEGPGRLWPLAHNVYSFLPSYMEASFLHVNALLGGGMATEASPESAARGGLLALDGLGLVICQFIHAGCVLLTAACAAALVGALKRSGPHFRAPASEPGLSTATAGSPLHWRQSGIAPPSLRSEADADSAMSPFSAWPEALAFALVLVTPWSFVTGSMMYNEMATAALFGAALVLAVQHVTSRGAPAGIGRSALAIGLLMGAACGCKPTAMFLCVPMAGLALFAAAWARPPAVASSFSVRVRSVVVALALATVGGTIAFGPPLARNWVAVNNPVFPAGAPVFGNGPWSPEQHARFDGAHHSPGALEAAGLLVSAAPREDSFDHEPRGLWHRHWSLLWPASAAGLAALAFVTVRARRTGALHAARLWGVAASVAVVGIGLALAWWCVASHAQSRFLVPLVGVLAATVAAAPAALASITRARPDASKPVNPNAARGARKPLRSMSALLASLAVALLVAFQGVMSVRAYITAAGPEDAAPGLLIALGTGAMTGESMREALAASGADGAMIRATLSPIAFANLTLKPGDALVLIGGSTPLYSEWPTAYWITYDAHTLGDSMSAFPNQPAKWTEALQSAAQAQIRRRPTYALIDEGELARLLKSAWHDPRVRLEEVRRWMTSETTLVREFPGGSWLVRLRP
ncbi:hypothetical protein BH11PLA1_BH11PLA1_13220 [soil metagenome]